MVIDLLWSDPLPKEEETKNEWEKNKDRDPDGSRGIVQFGLSRVEKFLKSNNHSLLLRSHQIVPTGYSNYESQVISINSCTNYCNEFGNDACFLMVQKKF